MRVDIAIRGKRRQQAQSSVAVTMWSVMQEQTPGEYVKYHRKLKGLTQDQLGASVGVTRTYINQIERARTSTGEPPNLSNELLERLADRLGVGHAEILEIFDRPMLVTDPDVKLLVEAYNGSSDGGKQALSSMAAALRASRAGSVGGKASGD